jgi:hypothetical protein
MTNLTLIEILDQHGIDYMDMTEDEMREMVRALLDVKEVEDEM